MKQKPIPRDIIADTHPPYDVFFAQRGLNPVGMESLVYFNHFYYGRYQPVNVAREVASVDYWQTFGRPMGDALHGPRVANAPQIIPSRIPNPFLIAGAPDSVVAYAKATTAAILQRRGKR